MMPPINPADREPKKYTLPEKLDLAKIESKRKKD
jgi:hypothetical protein